MRRVGEHDLRDRIVWEIRFRAEEDIGLGHVAPLVGERKVLACQEMDERHVDFFVVGFELLECEVVAFPEEEHGYDGLTGLLTWAGTGDRSFHRLDSESDLMAMESLVQLWDDMCHFLGVGNAATL